MAAILGGVRIVLIVVALLAGGWLFTQERGDEGRGGPDADRLRGQGRPGQGAAAS